MSIEDFSILKLMCTHQAQKKSKKASYYYKKNAKKCIFSVIYGEVLTLELKKIIGK